MSKKPKGINWWSTPRNPEMDGGGIYKQLKNNKKISVPLDNHRAFMQEMAQRLYEISMAMEDGKIIQADRQLNQLIEYVATQQQAFDK